MDEAAKKRKGKGKNPSSFSVFWEIVVKKGEMWISSQQQPLLILKIYISI